MSAIDPRFRTPIPTTAATKPFAFTPLCLDPDRWRVERSEDLERRSALADAEEQALLARRRTFNQGVAAGGELTIEGEDIAAGLNRIAKDRENIDKEAENIRTAHAEVKKRIPVAPIFYLRVPTSIEREQINSRLTMLGVDQVSTEESRANMVEAVYEHDWGERDAAGEIDVAANELIAEEKVAFLDSVWQRKELQQQVTAQWQQQEMERILDITAGAKFEEPTPQPQRIISVREDAQATLIITEVTKNSQRMRKVAAKNLAFETNNMNMLVRVNLVGVDGIATPLPIVPPANDGVLTQEVINALRGAMDEQYGRALSGEAWSQLVAGVNSMYSLDGFEEKNSDSPLERQSDLTGSAGPSGDMMPNGGSSTTSNSEALPVEESETIIDRSLGSTEDSKAMNLELNGSPTEEA